MLRVAIVVGFALTQFGAGSAAEAKNWRHRRQANCTYTAHTVVAAAPACAEKEKPTIVETAVGAKDFKTLVAALKAAGLVETLSDEGPFTVFAPTDEAFAKLPEGTLESLLKPENKEKLIAILKYHVVPGKVMAADVVKLNKAKTAEGSELKIDATDGVKINGAKVVKTDINCANGVIHVIDAVLIPAE